ncbi:MAG: sodium:proton antiporter [Verrucomicrobiota bacterium]
MWAVAVGFLLVVFLVLDWRNYLRAPKAVRRALTEPPDHWRFAGGFNLVFLGVILAAIFVKRPPYLREGLMLLAALASYRLTPPSIHQANHFSLHPIREVAVLFLGIFATMMPALDWLQSNGAKLGSPSLSACYWSCGFLSSVLDNAPTYLTFMKAISGTLISPEMMGQLKQLARQPSVDPAALVEPVRAAWLMLQRHHAGALQSGQVTLEQIEIAYLLANSSLARYVVGISVSAVFFGANTYIGNGPNFMVKSMADHQNVHTPSFVRYMTHYTVPIMLPMLALVWWLFFR